MSNLVSKLMTIKEKMARLDKDISLSEGRLQAHMGQLKEEWECDSIEAADKVIDDINKQLDDLEKKKEDILEELNNKYGWEL